MLVRSFVLQCWLAAVLAILIVPLYYAGLDVLRPLLDLSKHLVELVPLWTILSPLLILAIRSSSSLSVDPIIFYALLHVDLGLKNEPPICFHYRRESDSSAPLRTDSGDSAKTPDVDDSPSRRCRCAHRDP